MKIEKNILNDAELTTKAIELINRGEAKDPTDFVRILKIPLTDALELFNAIVEAKKLKLVSILDAESKIYTTLDKAIETLNDLDKKIKHIEELRKNIDTSFSHWETDYNHLKDLIEQATDKSNELKNTIQRADDILKQFGDIEKLRKTLNEFVSTLSSQLNPIMDLVAELSVSLFSREYCEHMDEDGYCTIQRLSKTFMSMIPKSFTDRFVVKNIDDFYYVNVKIHRGICAFCPYYKPKKPENPSSPNTPL